MKRNHRNRASIFRLVTPFITGAIFWVGLVSLSSGQHISEHRLFLAPGEMWPGKIFALQILPTGEIIDLYQQYTTTRWNSSLSMTSDKKFMYVSANTAIDEFRIESNGSLFSLGTFTCPGDPGEYWHNSK